MGKAPYAYAIADDHLGDDVVMSVHDRQPGSLVDRDAASDEDPVGQRYAGRRNDEGARPEGSEVARQVWRECPRERSVHPARAPPVAESVHEGAGIARFGV